MVDTKSAPTSKADLERQKLELEINELQLEWWKRPVYLSVALPVVLAIVGFLSVFWSGYFDQRKAVLESQIEELKAKRDEIQTSHNSIQADRDAVLASYRQTIALLIASDLYALRNKYPLPIDLSDEMEWCKLGGTFTLENVDAILKWELYQESLEMSKLSAREIALKQLSGETMKLSQFVSSEIERSRLGNLITTIVSEAENHSYTTLESKILRGNDEVPMFDKSDLLKRMTLDIEEMVFYCKGLPFSTQENDGEREAAKRNAVNALAGRVAYHNFMTAVSKVLVADVLASRDATGR